MSKAKASKGKTPRVKDAESHKHPESYSPKRPEVGTQSHFKKKKASATYRYHSSLAPAIYRAIGVYVVSFQWLESTVFQLTAFALDPRHTGSGRAALAGVWFGHLLRKCEQAVSDFVEERAPEYAEEFMPRLKDALARCKAIADHRNRVIHSAYVHFEAGGELRGIMRSYLRPVTVEGIRDVEFDQQSLSSTTFDKALADIGHTGFEVGQCHLQLIHWYRP